MEFLDIPVERRGRQSFFCPKRALAVFCRTWGLDEFVLGTAGCCFRLYVGDQSSRGGVHRVPTWPLAGQLFASATAMKFLAVLFLSAFTLSVQAHIGSPNVYFDGTAGAYPVHVIIRPPNVVPGLAEIAVRIEGEAPGRITAFPIYYDAGRKGAPPPDVAKPVRGETNLYSTTLWLMKPGGYGVEVSVEGSRGGGKVV